MPRRVVKSTKTLSSSRNPLSSPQSPVPHLSFPSKPKPDIALAAAVGDFLEELRQQVRLGARSQNTLESYERVLDLFVRQVGVGLLSEVNAFTVNRYLIGIREGTLPASRSRGSDAYVAKVWTHLVAFFKWGRRRGYPVDDGLFEFDGARYRFVIPKPLIEEVDHEEYIFSADEVDSIVQAARATGRREELIVELLLSTGIRPGELLRLELGDAESSELRIRDSKSRRGNVKVLRWAPIPKRVQMLLADYKEYHRPRVADPHLFLTVSGTPLTYQGLAKILYRLQAKAGLDSTASAYVFRHWFATDFLRRNPGQFEKLRKIMGHADFKTLQRYADLGRADLAENVETENPRA